MLDANQSEKPSVGRRFVFLCSADCPAREEPLYVRACVCAFTLYGAHTLP